MSLLLIRACRARALEGLHSHKNQGGGPVEGGSGGRAASQALGHLKTPRNWWRCDAASGRTRRAARHHRAYKKASIGARAGHSESATTTGGKTFPVRRGSGGRILGICYTVGLWLLDVTSLLMHWPGWGTCRGTWRGLSRGPRIARGGNEAQIYCPLGVARAGRPGCVLSGLK